MVPAGTSPRSGAAGALERSDTVAAGSRLPIGEVLGADDRDDDLLEAFPGGRLDDPSGIELRERLIAVPAGLVAGVLAGAAAFEDPDDLGHVGRGGVAQGIQLAKAVAVLGAGVLHGVDHREGFLAPGNIRGLLAGALFLAPDPQQVVVELEGDAQGPTERAVAADDLIVAGGEEGACLDRGGDEGGGLAADH